MQEENSEEKEQMTSHRAFPSRRPRFDLIRRKVVESIEKWSKRTPLKP
jgi:hypothetical protein